MVTIFVALLCLTLGMAVMIDMPNTSVMHIPLRGGAALTVQFGPLINKYYMRVEPSPISIQGRGAIQIDVWYRPLGIGRRHMTLRLPGWPMLVLGGVALLVAGVGRRWSMRTTHHDSDVQVSEHDIPDPAELHRARS